MKSFRNKKKAIPTKYILFGLTIVCVAAILLSLTLNITGGPLNTVAGYVFVPMQSGINNFGKVISKKANDYRTLSEVLEENAQLKKKNDELTTQLNMIRLESYELENYRELFALDEKYPSYEKVAANVIAKDSGNWFDIFTIDRGSNDGLCKGMNVIAGSGLVGIIIEVGPNYAKVRSIIDDASNVSAMVTSTQDNFNVTGDLESLSQSGVITFSELRDSEDKVNIGDSVVTSYVSDQYQQGILIGYITSIEENPNNLTKSGTITPVVDFEHIQEVLVILDLKNTGN